MHASTSDLTFQSSMFYSNADSKQQRPTWSCPASPDPFVTGSLVVLLWIDSGRHDRQASTHSHFENRLLSSHWLLNRTSSHI